MTGDEGQNWIVSDPTILDGRPYIRGTQISVGAVIAMLGSGMSVDEVLAREPGLTREAVEDVVRYTGRLSH